MLNIPTARKRHDVMNRHKERLDKLRWTVEQIRSNPKAELRVQGHHAVTGGLCCLRADIHVDTVRDLSWAMQRLFCAAEEGYLSGFAQRVADKLADAYVITLEVRGKDNDGDSLGYDFNWDTVGDLLFCLDKGMLPAPEGPNALQRVVDQPRSG